MKILIIGLCLLSSMSSFAKTELVCSQERSDSRNAKASVRTINNRIAKLEAQMKNVEITSVSVAKSASEDENTAGSGETICVVLKY